MTQRCREPGLVRAPQHQSGHSVLNMIGGLVVVTIIALALFQILPAQNRKSKLSAFMVDQTKIAGESSAKGLEKRVFEKAVALGAPVSKDDVKVQLSTKKVRITCSYVEELNFVIYKHEWAVDLDVDRPVFRF